MIYVALSSSLACRVFRMVLLCESGRDCDGGNTDCVISLPSMEFRRSALDSDQEQSRQVALENNDLNPVDGISSHEMHDM